MCVSVSTCAHGLVCLCVQETSWGGQSLWRDNGLSLKWSSLFVCLCLLALGEDLQGEGWSTERQLQLGSQDQYSAT